MKKIIHKTFSGSIVLITVLCTVSQLCIGQQKNTDRIFDYWNVGNDGDKHRFGTNAGIVLREIRKEEKPFTDLIMALNKGPATKEYLAEELDVCTSWLDQTLSLLTTFRFMKKTTNGQYYTPLPVLTSREMESLQNELSPLARKVAINIHDRIEEIKEIYYAEKTDSDPNWDNIAHLVIDKLLIDGTFHSSIGKKEMEQGLKSYYTEEQKMITAFFVESKSEFGPFGVNWYEFKNEESTREVYILHGGLFKRFNIPFNKYRRSSLMTDMLNRINTSGELIGLTNKEITELNELGWLNDGQLTVTVVNATSIKALHTILQSVGDDCARIVSEEFATILNAWEASDEKKYAEGAGDYIQVCYHSLFPCIIRELIKMGSIPSLPSDIPAHYGIFITTGSYYE